MLVLTRKRNQEILIGDNVKITILEINGDNIKIGVTAPRDITILRGELHQAVKESNISATTTDANADRLLEELLRNI